MSIRFAPPLFCSTGIAVIAAVSACSAGVGATRPVPRPAPPTGAGPQVEARALARSAAPDPEPPSSHAVGGPGWLGVELAKRDGDQAGVLLRAVMRGSPAERAGLTAGDVVLSIDGGNVARPSQLREHVMAAHAGARVSLGVLRGDETRLIAVDLELAPKDDELMRKNYVGSRAPDFGSLDTVQGSVIPSLPALHGRVVVLEFWASWCGACRVLAPTLDAWHDRYSAQGVTVLGVTNDAVNVASRAAAELAVGYPLASDGSGAMFRAYRAYALPTLFVIDRRGNVRDVLVGYSTPRLREIEALVRKLIAEG